MERAQPGWQYKRRKPLMLCPICNGAGFLTCIDLSTKQLWTMRHDRTYLPPLTDDPCGFCKERGWVIDHSGRWAT